MKKPNHLPFVFVYILILSTSLLAQEFDSYTVNGGALFTPASATHDYDGDGDMDIVILRLLKGSVPAGIEWLENVGHGQFTRHNISDDLSKPNYLQIADFNNDGLADYLVADIGSPAQLAIFERMDNGSYTKRVVETDSVYYQVTVADFNNDGISDIAAVGFGLSTVNLYMGDSLANFQKKTIVDSAYQVKLVESNDIDDDGDIDIIMGGGTGNFKILYNDGLANFDSSQTLYTWSNSHASANSGLAISDINNDGYKDIFTFSGVGTGGLYFLNGKKKFKQTPIDREGIDLGGDILITDLDSNGLKDIIRQQHSLKTLSVLYQDDSLAFRKEFIETNWDNTASGGNPQMSLADLDNDGDMDLVFPEKGNIDGDLSWFENINGKLYRHLLIGEYQKIRTPKFGDIDKDGDLDIVFSAGGDSRSSVFQENEISWYENRNENGFVEWLVSDSLDFPSDIELVDIDGDTNLDIVVTAKLGNKLVWYKKDGNNWLEQLIDDTIATPLGFSIYDIDSDTDLDIAVVSPDSNSVFWYENDGSANFTRKLVDATLLNPQKIEIADLNNDFEMDLIVAALDSSNSITIYLNDGNEQFSKIILLKGQQAYDIELGLWDDNSSIDIIASFDGEGGTQRNVAAFLNDGNANFSDQTLVNLLVDTRAIKLADVDNDDDPDLIFGSSTGTNTIQILLNDGTVSDSFLVLSGEKLEIYGMDTADFNGDGATDIIVTDQENGDLLLFTGTPVTSINDNKLAAQFNKYILYPNYPNPFNPQTTIQFYISKPEVVSVKIFDILGRQVRSLLNEKLETGIQNIKWDGKNESGSQMPSGNYFVKVKAGNKSKGQKILLLK